jgi:hypothetical protein
MQQDRLLNQFALPASELEQTQDEVQKLLALLFRPIPQVKGTAAAPSCCVQGLRQQPAYQLTHIRHSSKCMHPSQPIGLK